MRDSQHREVTCIGDNADTVTYSAWASVTENATALFPSQAEPADGRVGIPYRGQSLRTIVATNIDAVATLQLTIGYDDGADMTTTLLVLLVPPLHTVQLNFDVDELAFTGALNPSSLGRFAFSSQWIGVPAELSFFLFASGLYWPITQTLKE